jgi:hypothetical protein
LTAGLVCSSFVLMMQGFPISAKLPEDSGFGERFWYWRGISGQSYIHSIYSREACPPLPGAVFVAVRYVDGHRHAVAVGRFPAAFEGRSFDLTTFAPVIRPGDEIHVHLLARDNEGASRVQRDLQQALNERAEAVEVAASGFAEPAQLVLIAA